MNKIFKICYVSILILLTFLSNKTIAQNTEEKKVNFSVSGFIKSDIFYDSRQNVEALEGLLHIYPKDESLDANGNDINAKSSIGISDISSRIRGNVLGPDVLGAKLSGLLEVDFTGGIDGFTARVRLRHAYAKLNWEKTEILFGREWHPMFVKEVYPSVMSLNTGIPFQPFNRSPMLQVTQQFGKLKIIGAAISQSDYMNTGPDGKSAKYLKNTNIPNLHLQLQYKPGNFLIGIAGDYKCIQPRLTVDTAITSGITYITDSKLNSYAGMAFFKYEKSKLTVKGKAIYGQNLTESIMPGGYGVSKIDSITGKETYTAINNLYLWANIIYGQKTKFGLFAGYTKNLGSDKNFVDKNRIYGFAYDVDYFIRITPTISHSIEKVMFALELEHTIAAYGNKQDLVDFGELKSSHQVSNTRVLFSVFYFF
ncbi:MAG TPA: hypothetical protein P5132_06785 [Bacteroidales bacterium]|nr:hypothetical protein [Bacteroidales bacterium]